MVTYKAPPAPIICQWRSREDARANLGDAIGITSSGNGATIARLG